MRERLRLAVPNKGRLVDPTLSLLHDAGLVFEEHDRSLVSRVQNHPLDILFVRTGDVIEFVGDGVADLGITGGDLLAETGAELPVVRELGLRPLPARRRGAVRLPVRSRSPTSPAAASRRRTRTSRGASSRARAIAVDVVPLSGAVEVAPRLGLADAIVDLVSTGSTLAMNGLRPIGDILASEAVLVANPASRASSAPRELDAIVTMLGAVIAARGRKYLMMNAPATHLAGARGPAAGPRVAVGDPARARRDDRDPRGRRRRRGLGPAAAAQGRRRVGDPRAADREDPPVTSPASAPSSRAPAPRPARRPMRRRSARARRPVPARRRARSGGPRGGARDPRRRPRARRRRPSATPRRASAAGGPTAGCS